mgnify:CR=1 FL=1
MDVPTSETIMASFFAIVEGHPVIFLVSNFAVAAGIGIAFLYLETLKEMSRSLQGIVRPWLRNGYDVLDDSKAAAPAEDRASPLGLRTNQHHSKPAPAPAEADLEAGVNVNEEEMNRDDMQRELRLLSDKAEELEIKLRVNNHRRGSTAGGGSGAQGAMSTKDELKDIQNRRDAMRARLHGNPRFTKVEEPKATKGGTTLLSRVLKSVIFQGTLRFANGVCECRPNARLPPRRKPL